ncbi:aconitase X swivel domain-containing protein [Ornithinimicrobium cavernae]|uniref:aconitase X swivel domain-containing protein n=1 Tax=Ornithinimicrobium cavernae TaxID=2666047 RepID=UPI000D69223E|nr:DUF126 domain-containing protein [Ornithinimicrobium cavernae]
MNVQGTVLVSGSARGRLLVLEEPLNLWNGFDATTGRITAPDHPQAGQSIAGRVLWLEIKGATAGGSLTEALRLGTAPAAILPSSADTSLAVASVVARELYGKSCPIVVLPEQPGPEYLGRDVTVAEDGILSDT